MKLISEKEMLAASLKEKETNASLFSPEGIAKRDWFLLIIPTGKGYAGGLVYSSIALWWLVNSLLIYNLLRRRGLAHEFRSQITFARVPYLKTPDWMHLDAFIAIVFGLIFLATEELYIISTKSVLGNSNADEHHFFHRVLQIVAFVYGGVIWLAHLRPKMFPEGMIHVFTTFTICSVYAGNPQLPIWDSNWPMFLVPVVPLCVILEIFLRSYVLLPIVRSFVIFQACLWLITYRKHMLVLKDWHDLNDPMIAPFRGLNTIYTLVFVLLIMVILSSDRVLDCLSHHDGYLFQSLKSKNGDENGTKLFKRNNEKFL